MAEIHNSSVTMLDLARETETLWGEINEAVQRVLRSGSFILSREVDAFEEEVAAYLGVRHAVGLNSGTDALVIALRTLGIGAGDEVITTAFSFFATAEAISILGAHPVFVDVEEDTFNIDHHRIEAAINERTRAVLPVHLFGHPAAMAAITAVAQKHDLLIIEDCAQAIGATYTGDGTDLEVSYPNSIRERLIGKRVGSLGDVAAFSLYPTKNLGAYGDGGLLTTDSDDIAKMARQLRNHGESERYHHQMLGYNSRLDAIQAAILRVKLPYLEGWNRLRREKAARYKTLLDGLEATLPRDVLGHVYHQYTIRVPSEIRDALRGTLDEANISTQVYYPCTLDTLTPNGKSVGSLEVSWKLTTEVLSLPISPYLETDEQDRVAETLHRAIEATRMHN
ncbi:MAG: DegT/DnrJ/EryC1/StrS family aminotransferase [Trueperaceae bacterium]|nr:MAG: DegT/DnrJ/EryC1/StrS family aminotransferase [Trueperaceae bacterium]